MENMENTEISESMLDNDFFMILQSVIMGDLVSAKAFTEIFCEENKEVFSADFLTWMRTRLKKPSILPVPPELAGLVICEDVSESFIPNRYWVSGREEPLLEEISSLSAANTRLQNTKIPFSNSTLLYGAPGVGKTQFARYVAYNLNLPLVYIDLCQIVGSHMGSTAKNLQQIFQFASRTPCVFLLDELDAIAGNRGTISNGGSGDEVTRTTLGLMQCIDQLPSHVILIATTNREDMVDKGVMSRFTIKHEIKHFSPDELLSMVVSYFHDVSMLGGLDLSWDEADIRSQCGINTSQRELINLCNRAIVRAVKGDNKINLREESALLNNKNKNNSNQRPRRY